MSTDFYEETWISTKGFHMRFTVISQKGTTKEGCKRYVQCERHGEKFGNILETCGEVKSESQIYPAGADGG
jgi:hypothetical protein